MGTGLSLKIEENERIFLILPGGDLITVTYEFNKFKKSGHLRFHAPDNVKILRERFYFNGKGSNGKI